MRRLATGVAAVVLLLGVGVVVVNECESGGAMAGRHQTCNCKGVEWLVSDQTAADGPRRSVCIGWVASHTCFQNRGGGQIPC